MAEHRIQLGPDITQGLGAGSRPEVGRAAAEETMAEIERAVEARGLSFAFPTQTVHLPEPVIGKIAATKN